MVTSTSILKEIRKNGFEPDFKIAEGQWLDEPCKGLYRFVQENPIQRLGIFLDAAGGKSEYLINSRLLRLIKQECVKRTKCSGKDCKRFYKESCPIDFIVGDLRQRSEKLRFVTSESELKKMQEAYTRQDSSREGTDSLGSILRERIEDIIHNSGIPEIQLILNECIPRMGPPTVPSKRIHFLGKTSLKYCKVCGKIGEFGMRCHDSTKTLPLYYFKGNLDWLFFNKPQMVLELFVYHSLLENGFEVADLKNNVLVLKQNNTGHETELDIIVKDRLILVISKDVGSDSEKNQIGFCRDNKLPYLTISSKDYEDDSQYNKGALKYTDQDFLERLLEICQE